MASPIREREAGYTGFPTDPVEDAAQLVNHPHFIVKLRALRAPMYFAKTGKRCREVCLAPGRLYTFGRSRSSCDIIFLDRRVSRQHFQVYLDPVAKAVCLLEGAGDVQDFSLSTMKPLNNSVCKTSYSVGVIQPTTTNLKTVQRIESVKISPKKKVRRFGRPVENVVEASGGSAALAKSDSSGADSIAFGQTRNANLVSLMDENKDRESNKLDRPRPVSPCRLPNHGQSSRGPSLVAIPRRQKPSLNGMYVDGKKLVHGGHRILTPGSEVSLIACTEEGQPVDPGFGEAVGFVVELDCFQQMAQCEKSEISPLPWICSRKRSLAHLYNDQCGYKDISNAQVQSSKGEIPLQPVSLAASPLLPGQEESRCITGKTSAGSVCGGSETIVIDSQGTNFMLKQAPHMPKCRLNQKGLENTVTERLNSRLQAKSYQPLSGSVCNGRPSLCSAVSTESPVCGISKLTSEDKPTWKLSQTQLSDSSCRILSASDDGIRKQSIVSMDNTVSIPRTTVPDAIEEIAGAESLVNGAQEQRRLNNLREVADVAGDLLPEAARSDEDEGLLGDEPDKDLRSCRQGVRKAADDNSSVSLGRWKSYSSTAILSKTPRRTTREIMGLLKQVSPTSANVGTLDDGDNIFRGLVHNIQLSKQCVAKYSSRANAQLQGKETLEGRSSSSRVNHGKAVTPALARRPLILPIADGLSSIPSTEGMNEPEDKYGKNGVWNEPSDPVHITDQAISRCGMEHPGIAKELGRKSMESTPDSISKEEAEVSSGQCTGSGFLLNRLKDVEHSQVHSEESVSLQDLLAPTDDLLALFVATFTSDILWFLSSHDLSPDLPVTIACHDHERCWSTAEGSRSSSPFPMWPNVTVVYPPFPDACCFATEKRQGIGCHHPKIFLLLRHKSIRVIVTSANLTSVQWLHVTNSVWWQDFPRNDSCDYKTLFCMSEVDETGLIHNQTQSDFAVHLSSFVASLVADVPSVAHWAPDLAKYNFSSAAASLITSIPGLHGCPCPPVPRSIWDVVKYIEVAVEHDGQRSRKFLAAVDSKVVGISHRFKDSADPYGKRLRALAAILNDTNLREGGVLTVQLKRVRNVAADPNAVSVIVASQATQIGSDMLIGKDGLQIASDSQSSTPNGSVHIGFLPRTVAKWVAPLYDSGLCTFAACVWPNEVLSVASGLSKKGVRLVMYVFEGRSFSLFSASGLSIHLKVALSCLLRSMERPLGLWRLHQVLSKYNWLDSAETNFVFGSSSIGTSLDAAFLAAFSVAAGKKAPSSDSSSDSDPEWGAWTAAHEANSPSIGLVFPTIKRIRAAKGGPGTHQGILCFAESTWERLKTARLLHDAVPFPPEREGIPMHVKVAHRRFQNNPGEAPYGWIYCGSHNFSPAAWGRPLAKTVHHCTCRKTALGCALFISNYEVGLVFVEPPPRHGPRNLKFKPLDLKSGLDENMKETDLKGKRPGLDNFVLPFQIPAPKYEDVDQPATGKAIRNAVVSWRTEHLLAERSLCEDGDIEMAGSEAGDSMDEIQSPLQSEDADFVLPADLQMEEEYGETLWSQIDSIMPQSYSSIKHLLIVN